MNRRKTTGLVISTVLLIAAALFIWDLAESLRPPPPPPLPAATVPGFEEFSGVGLPDTVRDDDVRITRGDQDLPLYKLAFSTTPDTAEEICTGIGGWLAKANGIPAEEQKLFGISKEDAAAYGDDARGCSALDLDRGVQNEAVVLYPAADTAEMYVRAYEMPR